MSDPTDPPGSWEAARPGRISAMKLTREVRCFLVDGPDEAGARNTWAGSPAADQLLPYVTLRATVEGPVDPRTGYVCNIVKVDAMLRDRVVPALLRIQQGNPSAAFALANVFPTAAANCPQGTVLRRLQLRISPFLFFSKYDREPDMIRLTQSFEFSASHRLHCSDLSDEENRRLFGKCSNPNGHGHNYVLDVSIDGQVDPTTGLVIELPRFQRIVNEAVISPFDHKNLNLDCAEFTTLNPSVENIARVIWDRLESALEPCRLSRIRVWETSKTYAECTREG